MAIERIISRFSMAVRSTNPQDMASQRVSENVLDLRRCRPLTVGRNRSTNPPARLPTDEEAKSVVIGALTITMVSIIVVENTRVDTCNGCRVNRSVP